MFERKAAFAKRIGRNRSWVTRAAQAGRLVVADDGLVDVERSMALMESTRGARFDVEERWDRHREAASADIPADDINAEVIGRRTRIAQMRTAEAEAEKRRMEVDELSGALVRREEIERGLASAMAIIMSQIEAMPDRLVSQVHGVQEVERVRARIQDELELLCRRVSDELGRAAHQRQEKAA